MTATAELSTSQNQFEAVLGESRLVLQAVVTLGDNVPDGNIVQAVTIPWFEIVRLFKKDPNAIHECGWRKWEEIVAGAYKAAGYDVILTTRSNDGGRDVIATRDDLGSIRIIDQVKAYSPEHLVTANDVRAMLGVLNADPNASKGIVTTTSDFAPGVYTEHAIQQYVPNRLDLRPRDKLIEWLIASSKRADLS